MSRLGIADLGVATMNDMRDNAAMIAIIDPAVPVIADTDTGYGGKSPPFPNLHLLTKSGPLMVDRTTAV
jgi:2-methylisocitrate lyase-like PEP mutase family enzyme